MELVEQFTATDAEGLPHIVCVYRDAAGCTIYRLDGWQPVESDDGQTFVTASGDTLRRVPPRS